MQVHPVAFCLLATSIFATTYAQQPSSGSSELRPDLHWRMIGPFRGGRTRAATGVLGEPNVFYIGQGDGGVWKSDDYGRTWNPIFDGQPSQSIGAIAVAAFRQQYRLRGQRRRPAPARPLCRRRHL